MSVMAMFHQLSVGSTAALTCSSSPPNMCSQCPRPPNPWGRQSPITASSAGSAGEAWVWSTKRKT
jgi:hypothetical protein